MIISSWGPPCGREVQHLVILSLLHKIQDKKSMLGFVAAQDNDIHILVFSKT